MDTRPFCHESHSCHAPLPISLAAVVLLLFTNACATYRVDSLVDAPDANPGDHKCERAMAPGGEGGLCTLRAAVMESNASIWRDTIEVPGGGSTN